jgi:phosphohistidine phosphatase
MKTLILARHAKSSWDDPAVPDRDRPLNDRGKRDAPAMGKRLAKDGVKPGLILSSPARRARKTARLLAKALDCKPRDIQVNDRLYCVEAEELLRVIRGLDDDADSVMLVGHNPELTELAHRLSSEVPNLPTCAIAVYKLDIGSWSAAGKDKPAKVTLYTPRPP